MIPEDDEYQKVEFSRNSKKSFLVGASWSHYSEWPFRTTHFYLGLWVLTVRTPS